MILAVLDTVVFVRSLLNLRSRSAHLVFGRTSEYRLVVSPPVVREIFDVLQRPLLNQRLSRLPGRDVAAVLGMLGRADAVEIDLATIPRVSRDAKDDRFLATAKAGGAAFIVSEDDDLLVPGEYEGIKIVNAETFLRFLNETQDGLDQT